MNEDNLYDVIIIGAGPAGLNAAVYAARYRMKTIVFGEIAGGMAAGAYDICNFLSYKKIRGFELAMKMKEHVVHLGVEIKTSKVTDIRKNKYFEVMARDETYFAKKIILACGSDKRKLNLESEDKFLGRGISYCAICDAAFFKDKIVAVAGGSDAALTAAILLSEYAQKIYIVYRKERFFRAEPTWIHLVEKSRKISTVFNSNIVKLEGKDMLESIVLDSGKRLTVNGLFVEIGSIPQTGLAEKLSVKLENDYIKTYREQKTNVSGVFACGDVTNNALKQIIVAAAEGAIAAKTAYDELIEESQ